MLEVFALSLSLAVTPVDSTSRCRQETREIERTWLPPATLPGPLGAERGGLSRMQANRLSRADTLCWNDPDRALRELRELENDLRLQAMRPSQPPAWRDSWERPSVSSDPYSSGLGDPFD